MATKQGLASYQLSVVVDDDAQQVNRIVRGDDMLTSTCRQSLVKRSLNLVEACQYWHLPLVVGADGRRLAKRHGDSRLSHYRDQGVPVARVLGLMAEWCGIMPRAPISLPELQARFALDRLPRRPIVFDASADDWLGH